MESGGEEWLESYKARMKHFILIKNVIDENL